MRTSKKLYNKLKGDELSTWVSDIAVLSLLYMGPLAQLQVWCVCVCARNEQLGQKTWYTARFVRVILAQGPCSMLIFSENPLALLSRDTKTSSSLCVGVCPDIKT